MSLIKKNPRRSTVLIIALAVFSIVTTMNSVLTSAALPTYKFPSPDADDLMSGAYDSCMSRLTGKIPEEEAASKCFDFVYEEGSEKPSPDALATPHDTKSEDQRRDTAKNEEHGTTNNDDPDDEQSEESEEDEEPQDQIMIIENGRKIAEY